MLSISVLPCLDDNYIWLLRRGRELVAVDPGDAAPLADLMDENNQTLAAILLTHRHFDHIGGVAALVAKHPAPVYGPEGIAGVDHPLCDGDTLELLGEPVEVIATPGHTREHLSYLTSGALFCGDTLFAGGCGRVFDGEPGTLYASLQRLARLPAQTRVCCTHEYTLANLKFAAKVEPGNATIALRLEQEQARRASGQPTLPSSIALELATNPFLRCESAEVIHSAQKHAPDASSAESVFIALREWKNHFK